MVFIGKETRIMSLLEYRTVPRSALFGQMVMAEMEEIGPFEYTPLCWSLSPCLSHRPPLLSLPGGVPALGIQVDCAGLL
jgi:hypothetical protein